MIKQIPKTPREMEQFFRDLLLKGLEWTGVSKEGSKLADIVTRTHDMLQDVLGWGGSGDEEKTRHISDVDGTTWQGHVEATGNPHRATTEDIPDATDFRYVTDANLVVINNTTGTNTGDQMAEAAPDTSDVDPTAILVALNDLKAKMRTAGLLGT